MKYFLSALLLSVFSITPAFADDTGKAYVLFDVGSASYTNVTVGAGTYPNPGMYRIGLGFHFNNQFAIEIGATKFGDSIISGATTGTVYARSSHVVAVGSFPLNADFDLIGKLGLANNTQRIDATSGGYTVASMGSSQSDMLIGFGAQYHVSPTVTLRAQYDNYGKFGWFGTTGKIMEASATSVGVILNF